uniref:F-box domain-containing protein n=2 Tax=Caenorhabditis tropicalis TaxID=1561998 RepID=A0A1I7TQW1_9PELO
MSSVDEELSNKVFNNPLILEYILSYVVPDFLPNFKIREYGPFDMQSLFNTRYRRCFKRLIVTDQLFDRIANDCVRYSSSKEECYRKLNIFINVPIRCGMLVFWISESRRLNQDDRLPNHHSMPREVFELMINMWKPKAIEIHFKYDYRIDISRKQWIDSEYFTKVRLNDPYEPFGDDSNLPKLRYVELNLRDSLLCSTDFCFLDPTKTWYRGFDNVIANIRSVFPTDQIIVKGFNMYNYDVEPFSDVFSNLLKIVQKGDNEKLTIKSQFFIDYDPKRADSEQISIQIPKEYTLLDYRSLFYHPELPEKLQERPDRCRMRKWICKKFRFEDEKKNFHFQLNTFLPESVIKLKDVDAGTKSLLSIFE